jgi:TetR/AcrR family transcriptional repressor of bet genes
MHSENSTDEQNPPTRSFIEEARRAQIVSATIETVAHLGYAKASLAKIAERARISTSLILYHFSNREELFYHTLGEVAAAWYSHVQKEVAVGTSASEKLRIYIESSLAYMGTRPSHYATLIEIVFNARTPDGVLLYLTNNEDPAVTLLQNILTQGQQHGEFRAFNVHHIATAITGAIGEFFTGMHKTEASLESYTTEIVYLFTLATQRSQP